jgi:trehalose 6-phosphate phosphatase
MAGLLRAAGPIALFLDFDGVIAELAPTPDSVTVEAAMIGRLQSLNSALDGALAIVSGRDLAGLDALLAPLRLAAAGDHGNVRRSGNGQVRLANPAASTAAAAVSAALRDTFGDPRIIVEHKASAVAVHYRLAPERQRECIVAVQAAIADAPALTLAFGKMVVEARAAGVSKGTAVRAFMQEPPFAGRTPLCVGDDVTDEDGFAAAQELGGAGIKVGPGETVAQFRIGATRDVPALLDALIRHASGAERWRA